MNNFTILNNGPSKNVLSSFNKAQRELAGSSAKLASGVGITAKEAAAATSIAAGLGEEEKSLGQARLNADIAGQVLGIADGSLTSMSSILERLKSLQLQSATQTVTDTERVFLQQEFDSLSSEINRLVQSTKFNGQELLNGELKGGSQVVADVNGASNTSSVTLTMGATAYAADEDGELVINGVSFDLTNAADATTASIDLDFSTAASAADRATLLANVINNTDSNYAHSGMTQENRDKLTDLVAVANGGTVTISSKNAGSAGLFKVEGGGTSQGYLSSVTAGATTNANSAAATTASDYASGSTTGSLGVQNVTVQGTVAGTLVGSISSRTESTSGFVNMASGDFALNAQVTVFGQQFTFVDNVTNDDTQILRGNTDLDTAKNFVNKMNNSSDPQLANYVYEANDNSGTVQLKVTSKAYSTDVNGMVIDFAANDLTLASGVSGGIDVSRVTDNDAFNGAIQGFTAKMTGSDSVVAKITVGSYTYEANVENTAPSASTVVRFKSNDAANKGGSFDVTLASDYSIATQENADNFAEALDVAFRDLKFYQQRDITSFDPSGTVLEETVVTYKMADYDKVGVKSASVVNSQDNSSQNASIIVEMTDGRVFEKTDLGKYQAQGAKVELTGRSDSNEMITLRLGRDLHLDDRTVTSNLQDALLSGFNTSNSGMTVQVGVTASEVINITMGDMSTSSLFDGKEVKISTYNDAVAAAEYIQMGIDTVKAERANVGALQSRFEYTSSAIESSIINLSNAKSAIMDTKVAEESTRFQQSNVKLMASISMLATLNMTPQNLLQLIQ